MDKKLIAKYKIEEASLQKLINDLEACPDKSYRDTVLKNALKGVYANSAENKGKNPATLLANDLEKIYSKFPQYNYLKTNHDRGLYDHEKKPEEINPLTQSAEKLGENRNGFMNGTAKSSTGAEEINDTIRPTGQ